jgi:arginine utilization regulatory protein
MSPSPVLIFGETGTGKELFAQSIHNSRPRANQPFVAINCAAVPESLLESILFGTVKGAFTGAQNTKGVFEQAGSGTLFLDEINSMPRAMQTKLLRVLQEKSVRRVGADYEIPVKCLIITSSNEQLEECVRNGTLRNDLYYRLALLRINIPPLREWGKDIEILARHFLKTKGRLYGKKNIGLSTDFLNYLYQHSWPGNVRELEHTIESCVAVAEDGEELHLYHLPPHLRHLKNSQENIR